VRHVPLQMPLMHKGGVRGGGIAGPGGAGGRGWSECRPDLLGQRTGIAEIDYWHICRLQVLEEVVQMLGYRAGMWTEVILHVHLVAELAGECTGGNGTG